MGGSWRKAIHKRISFFSFFFCVVVKKIYGNTPGVERTRDVETKVLEQTVEEVDLKQVIKALNGIE